MTPQSAIPPELARELHRQGIHPSDVSEWKHAGQNRYEVRLKPSNQEVVITIVRDPDIGRYWGD